MKRTGVAIERSCKRFTLYRRNFSLRSGLFSAVQGIIATPLIGDDGFKRSPNVHPEAGCEEVRSHSSPPELNEFQEVLPLLSMCHLHGPIRSWNRVLWWIIIKYFRNLMPFTLRNQVCNYASMPCILHAFAVRSSFRVSDREWSIERTASDA